jgi:hypothetical protein
MAQARLGRQNVTDTVLSLDWSHYLSAHIDCAEYLKARFGPDVPTDKPLLFTVMGGTHNQAGSYQCYRLPCSTPCSIPLLSSDKVCNAAVCTQVLGWDIVPSEGLHPTIWTTKKKAHERAAACMDVHRIRDAYGKAWPLSRNIWEGYVINPEGTMVTMPNGEVFTGKPLRAAYDEYRDNLLLLGNGGDGGMSGGGGDYGGAGSDGGGGGGEEQSAAAAPIDPMMPWPMMPWLINGSSDIVDDPTPKLGWGETVRGLFTSSR